MASRSRAGAACQHCHARKSRCDGQLNGLPCSSCRQRGLVGCRILPSNRGQYVRKHALATRRRKDDQLSLVGNAVQHTEAMKHCPPRTSPDPRPSPPALLDPAADGLPSWPDRSERASSPSSGDGEEALPVYQAPQGGNEETSWSSIFESFIKCRVDGQTVVDRASITYLGESFPLAPVLEGLRRDGRLQLHHPGPASGLSPSTPSVATVHPSHLAAADLEFLRSRGAFLLPTPASRDTLFNSFVHRVYPFYPMVIMPDLIHQHRTQALPWLLLQSIYFAGAAFCPLSALHLAGFSSRRAALETFYKRAKLLFDFGYEREKVVLLQSVTLLTFWPSSPADTWTFYHWLGFGVTLAESLGLHRSMANINMPEKDRSLLKRIWWILTIRDAFGSALFGRPVRINGVHCDVEYPTEDDFIYDYFPDMFPESDIQRCAAYLCSISQLSLYIRDITTNRFTTGFPTSGQEGARAATSQALAEWRAMLPQQLDWDLVPPACDPFVATLAVLYNGCLIFMSIQRSRPAPPELHPPDSGAFVERPRQVAAVQFSDAIHDAAAQSIDIISSLVPNGQLASMPHEIFVGLFVAQAVTYTGTHSTDLLVAKLAQSQLKTCQLLLYEVRDFWDPAMWITRLFDGLLAKERPDVVPHQPLPDSVDIPDFQIPSDWETFMGDFRGFQHLFT